MKTIYKKILSFLIVMLCWNIFIYLVFSNILCEFNITKWDEIVKLLFLHYGFSIGLVISLLFYLTSLDLKI